MARKFAQSLTTSEMKEARMFEAEGLTSFSQAVKAFERRNIDQISTWRRMIDEVEQQRQQTLFDPENDPTTEDFDDAINHQSPV